MSDTMKERIRILTEGFDGAKTTLSLSAQASLHEVYQAPDSPDMFSRTLSGPLSWQQRNGITVEEAVLSPNLAPQWIATLLALDTRVTFPGEEGLLMDYPHWAMARAEQFSCLKIPLDVTGRVWGEAHVSRTPADQPIVTAIAVVVLTDGIVRRARLALTGTWRQHARLAHAAERLIDRRLSQELIQEVVTNVMEEISPPDDFRGSAEYRRAMAGVLTRRVLEACLEGVNQL